MELLVFTSAWGLTALHVAFLLYVCWAKHSEPAEASFWLLVIALIPVGGIILYLFFGITHIERKDWRIRAFHNANRDKGNFLQHDLTSFLSPHTANSRRNLTLDRLFPNSLLLAKNRIKLLQDGTQVYPKMLADIRKAKHTIRLQSFIFMGDELGIKILEALEERAKAGVDVKLLFDSFGSFKAYFSPKFQRIVWKKHPNLQIVAFSPLSLLTPWKFQLRNHRKLLVIDGKIAYSGGINISIDNQRKRRIPQNRYIHDLHCRITGPAVSQFSSSFFRDWHYSNRRKSNQSTILPYDFPEPRSRGKSVIRVINSGPGDFYQGTRLLFFGAAAMAKKSLTIVTPYFVPGSAYVEALAMAVARGVEVRIVLPYRNNHFYADFAAQNFYPQLLHSGVRIFRKQGVFSHTKALLVDNEWGFMGSSNCDSRSFRLNFELDFCFEGGDFIHAIREQIQKELSDSLELPLLEVENRPLIHKLICGICALLSPIL